MSDPHVTILMATYNGAAFIEAQLVSICDQQHKKLTIIISDDGSTDATIDIARQFADRHPGLEFVFLDGPGQGSSANFWHLVDHIPRSTDYAAFADQDDVWMSCKVTAAIEKLPTHGGPALYGARSIETNHQLKCIRASARLRLNPCFENALVQNVFSANSCVVNRAGINLLRRIRGRGHIFDWYLYQVFSGAGATLIHDAIPRLYYRQHGQNQIGANRGFKARINRVRQVLSGEYRGWNEANIAALNCDFDLLTRENQKLLRRFERLRKHSGVCALWKMFKTRLKRQGPVGQLGLYLSAAFGKL